MLKGLHHIHYLIRNRNEMVAYMERTFGMKPDRLLEDEGGKWKEVQYFAGPAILKMTEHAPGTKHAKIVEERGPGIHHVYWAVENIVEAARQLKGKGTGLLGTEEQGFRDGFRDGSKSPHGYYETYIDPEDSLGIEFRIVNTPDSLSIDIARAPK
jgi:methylmalonyl-CoA/ethylmalonyl-CoA epimerase